MVDRIKPQEPACDFIMEIAWRDFILWAHSKPDMRAAFTVATGKRLYEPPRTPLDAMIDQATGADAATQNLEEFVQWVTKEHWGEEQAPELYKAAVAALGGTPAK